MCFAAVLEYSYQELCDHCEVTLKLTKYKTDVSKIQPTC